MNKLFKNSSVYFNGRFITTDILVCNGIVEAVESGISAGNTVTVIDCTDKYIFPGFTDAHVHLREPGFCYKETISSGTAAAAHGGFTTVLTMPNLEPVPDTFNRLYEQLRPINKNAVINVIPFASITVDEKGQKLSDFYGMKDNCAGYSDDGHGVQESEIMRQAMLEAKKYGKVISAHCEVNSLLNGGCIHDGEYARNNGFKGISSESEWKMIERDVLLAEETGCSYHVCHISAAESVEIIRKDKARGVDVTCETAPHYLLLDENDLKDEGRFKMNPPLRSAKDRKALIEGVKDGTIDMIATDHAPHSAQEKAGGLKNSLFGVVGLETAFSSLYTGLVKTNIISLEKLIELMAVNPSARFSVKSGITAGKPADFTVFDLNKSYTVNPDEFLSMGRSTPFEGESFYGKCLMTICGGKCVYTCDGGNKLD